MVHQLNVVYLSSYPPRQCGIATFTRDLAAACSAVTKQPPCVVALTNVAEGYDYPADVRCEIYRDQLEDYRRAADFINKSDADVLCIQHEYGLFGGAAGAYLTTLLRNVNKPIVTTLHTVLKDPRPEYEFVTRELIRCSDALVVLSNAAREILISRYGAPKEKVHLIYHGVPDVPCEGSEYAKRALKLEGRLVLLTFGLLSRNKGIETAIEALPRVVKERPDVLYIVLGATHPEVKQHEGEAYRRSLEQRVAELGLAGNVLFVDKFVDLPTLLEYLKACDLYITPYLHREQVSSGTLSYALAMGKAVISTPYWYAEELLADGRGVLVPFRDPEALSEALLTLIADPERLAAIRKAAYAFGRKMLWSEVGKAYVDLFARVRRGWRKQRNGAVTGRAAAARLLPEIKLDHLLKLTDDTGLIQHAAYGVPDQRHGYSSDDVGRALAALAQLDGMADRDTVVSLMSRYLSFLQYAQTANGHFHNFMGYDRQFQDGQGSEDTLGRVVWGLGCVIRRAPQPNLALLAEELLERALEPVASLRSPRAMAYAVCGLSEAARKRPDRERYGNLLRRLADGLCDLYEACAKPDWRWFEERIAYGNAKMCEALLLAYQVTGVERYRRIGLESLDFLIDLCWKGSYFDLIGNQGWFDRGGEPATFSQQPIDAGYLAEACDAAFEVTGDDRYARYAEAALGWFLGQNRLGVPLYDEATGAVFDGLEQNALNLNQGAESVVCFLLALGRLHARARERARSSPTIGQNGAKAAPVAASAPGSMGDTPL